MVLLLLLPKAGAEVFPKVGVVEVFILLLLLFVVLLLPKTLVPLLLLLPKPEEEVIPNPMELFVVVEVLLNPPKVGVVEVFIVFMVLTLALAEVVVALKVNPEL